MPQLHQENQGVGLYGVVRFQGIQSTVSVGANTWKAEETAKISIRNTEIIIQMNRRNRCHDQYPLFQIFCKRKLMDFTYLVKQISTPFHLNYKVTGNFRGDRPALRN
jgi:hypothetical protein